MKKLLLFGMVVSLVIFAYPLKLQSQSLTWRYNAGNGHVYALVHGPYWQDVEDQAKSLGAHLITINDQAENDWILSIFGDYQVFWIGFNDLKKEGQWVWSSKESATYTNWHCWPTGLCEPNNGGGGEEEHVAVFNLIDWDTNTPIAPGFWNDEPDGGAQQGIIEREYDFYEIGFVPAWITIVDGDHASAGKIKGDDMMDVPISPGDKVQTGDDTSLHIEITETDTGDGDPVEYDSADVWAEIDVGPNTSLEIDDPIEGITCPINAQQVSSILAGSTSENLSNSRASEPTYVVSNVDGMIKYNRKVGQTGWTVMRKARKSKYRPIIVTPMMGCRGSEAVYQMKGIEKRNTMVPVLLKSKVGLGIQFLNHEKFRKFSD